MSLTDLVFDGMFSSAGMAACSTGMIPPGALVSAHGTVGNAKMKARDSAGHVLPRVILLSSRAPASSLLLLLVL